MSPLSKMCMSATACALLVLSGTAQAQNARNNQQFEQTLSSREVRSFLQSVQDDLTDIVRSRNFRDLIDWTQNYIADGAHITMSVETYHGDQRTGFSVMSMDKADWVRSRRLALSALQNLTLQNYSLEIDPMSIQPIGPNAAMVTVHYVENAALELPAIGRNQNVAQNARDQNEANRQNDTDEGNAQSGRQMMRVEGNATCHQIIQRSEESDHLEFGLTTCEASARI